MNIKKKYIGLSVDKLGRTIVYNIETSKFYEYNEQINDEEALREVANKTNKKLLLLAPFVYPLFLLLNMFIQIQNLEEKLLYPVIIFILLIIVLGYFYGNIHINKNVSKYENEMKIINRIEKHHIEDGLSSTKISIILLVVVIYCTISRNIFC